MDKAVRKKTMYGNYVVTSSWHKWIGEGRDNAYYHTVNRLHCHKFSSNSSVTEGTRRKNSRLFDPFAVENYHWRESG